MRSNIEDSQPPTKNLHALTTSKEHRRLHRRQRQTTQNRSYLQHNISVILYHYNIASQRLHHYSFGWRRVWCRRRRRAAGSVMVRADSAPIPLYAGSARPIKELDHSIIIRRKTGKSPDHRWVIDANGRG